MTTCQADAVWLNDHDVCTIEELASASHLSVADIEDLIQTGVIGPIDERVEPRLFHLRVVATLNTARRLRDDLLLDQHGVALTLILLQRIDRLQAELTALKARLPHKG